MNTNLNPLNFSQYVHQVLASGFLGGRIFEGEFEVVDSNHKKPKQEHALIAVVVKVETKLLPIDSFGNFSSTKNSFAEYSIVTINCELEDFMHDFWLADIDCDYVVTKERKIVQVTQSDIDGNLLPILEEGSGIRIINDEITLVSKSDMSGNKPEPLRLAFAAK